MKNLSRKSLFEKVKNTKPIYNNDFLKAYNYDNLSKI